MPKLLDESRLGEANKGAHEQCRTFHQGGQLPRVHADTSQDDAFRYGCEKCQAEKNLNAFFHIARATPDGGGKSGGWHLGFRTFYRSVHHVRRPEVNFIQGDNTDVSELLQVFLEVGNIPYQYHHFVIGVQVSHGCGVDLSNI